MYVYVTRVFSVCGLRGVAAKTITLGVCVWDRRRGRTFTYIRVFDSFPRGTSHSRIKLQRVATNRARGRSCRGESLDYIIAVPLHRVNNTRVHYEQRKQRSLGVT